MLISSIQIVWVEFLEFIVKLESKVMFVIKVSLLFCKCECMVNFEEGDIVLSNLFGEISEVLQVFILFFFFIVFLCIIYENVYGLNYFFYY